MISPTALALVGGAALAEINISGSGTTDGGLSFGGSAGFDTGDDKVNEGTVFISGAFGTVTFGDNDSADLVAGGIADVGLNGVGVDDVVEGLRGGTANQMRYDNSFGQISIAFSAGTGKGTAAIPAVEGTMAVPGVFGYSLPGATTAYEDRLYQAQMPRTEFEGLAASITAFNTAFDAALTTAYAAANDGAVYAAPDAGDTRNDEGVAVDSGGTALEGDDLANFEFYEMHHDLGEGGAVGGADEAADTRIPGSVVVRAPIEAADGTPGMPATRGDTEYAFGMSFNASGVTVGLGYDSEKTVSLGMGFSTGDIGTNVLYVKQDDGDTGLGADVSYTMDASTLTLAYASSEGDDAMGINLGHDLGGGASLVAGFGQVKDVNRANMGLKFSF
ncbi:MAG: porin [Rhodospirillaceae bacterium]|nr:porin [Rhodospirillaceae bacterium]